MDLDTASNADIRRRELACGGGKPPPMPPVRIASIVLNHLVPVVATIWGHGSASRFLLLAVFNIVFAMMANIFANIAVSMLQAPAQANASFWNRAEPWVSFCLVAVFFTGAFIALFGGIVFAMLPAGGHVLADRHLWIGAAMIIALALPGLFARSRADLRANLGEGARKARDQAAILLQVATGVAMMVLSSYAMDWFGSSGLYSLMFAITAFFIVRDLLPDVILRQLFPGY